MTWFAPYVLVLLVSALVSVLVGLLSWRRRATAPAAPALVLIMFGLTEWAGAAAAGLALGGRWGAELCVLAIYPGVSAAVAGFFWLCRVVAGHAARPTRRVVLLLAVEPVVVTLAALTNGRHGLLIGQVLPAGSSGLPGARFGPLFWAHTTYSYLLLGWGVIALALAWRTVSDLHRRQLSTMLLGALVQLLLNVFSVVAVGLTDGPDLTATTFVITGLIFWWALFRQGPVQVVPVARAVVLERLSDAVIVIDVDGRVLDYNPAALRLAEHTMPGLPADIVGMRLRNLVAHGRPVRSGPADPAQGATVPAGGALPAGGEPDGAVLDQTGLISADPAEIHGEYRLRTGDGQIDLDVRTGRLTDRRGALTGHVIVARDITELSERKRELTRANGRLEEQLATIERLRADLAEQAVRDVLTGLHNRRYLMRRFDEEVRRVQADRGRLGVVLLDIDHFKSVNDRFGHAVGDDVLVATAQALSGLVRADDTVARYGGEEFVVLLPGAGLAEACERAEEWRRTCGRVSVASRHGPVSTTFSAGVAAFPEYGTTPAVLLQSADEALYAAKAAGRDQVLPARVRKS